MNIFSWLSSRMPKKAAERGDLVKFGREFAGERRELDTLTPTRQKALKKRVMAVVEAQANLEKNAAKLDRKLAKKTSVDSDSRDFFDLLAVIASQLLSLPKVLPRVMWREETRGQLISLSWFQPVSILRWASAATAVVVTVTSIAWTSFLWQAEQTFAEIAYLQIEEGSAKLRAADSRFFVPAESGVAVRLGDTIRLDSDSAAELRFFDESSISLAEETEVVITDFAPHPTDTKNSSIRMAVVEGSVGAKVNKTEKAAVFEVETPKGVVQARQADFAISVEEDGDTKVETTSAEVALLIWDSPVGQKVAEGQQAVMEAENPVEIAAITENVPVETVAFEVVLAEIDILSVRLFDALEFAEAGDTKSARIVRESVAERFAQLMNESGLELTDDSIADGLALEKVFVGEDYWPEMAVKLAQFKKADEVLSYFLAAPELKYTVGVFEILEKDRYRVEPEISRLFIAVSAKKIAAELAQDSVDELIELVAAEHAKNLGNGRVRKNAEDFVELLEAQPVFIPALEAMVDVAPEGATRLLEIELTKMHDRMSQYIGG